MNKTHIVTDDEGKQFEVGVLQCDNKPWIVTDNHVCPLPEGWHLTKIQNRVVTVRMPAKLHDALKKAAREEGVSVNKYILGRLKNDID